jgi:hypothetical protein
MNYNLIEDKTDNYFWIEETPTNQLIKKVFGFKEAKQTMRYLNLGGGFDGWTPAFMLKKIEIFNKNKVNVV